jgi:hypothetical protein
MSVLEIAKFVNAVVPVVYSASERVYTARKLYNGGTWEPRPWDVQQVAFDLPEASMFDIKIKLPGEEDASEKIFAEQQTEQKVLLMLGATGDAEAAIEYCRLTLRGKNEHNYFGRA